MIAHRFGATGREVPVVGQGSWNIPLRGERAEEAKRAIRRGIELGMVHIDTAEMYGDGGSEKLVGDAIAGLPREALFLVSKVLPSNAGYVATQRACEATLKRMRVEYLDCYLLHWRGPVPIGETMRALEKLQSDGKIRALGVSNFDVDDLEDARAELQTGRIACNQVLYHLTERTIEDHELPYCREHDIAVVAYTPFGRGEWETGPGVHALEAVAAKHAATPRQVSLAFLTRDDLAFAIPKSSTVAHVDENAGAGELRLDADDIAAIDRAYPKRRRRGGIPTL